MGKDYSEYQLTEYDKYRLRRSNSKDVRLDYFSNTVGFIPAEKRFVVTVDSFNELNAMQTYIDEYYAEKAKREGKPAPEETEDDPEDEFLKEEREEKRKRLAEMQKRYDFIDSDIPEQIKPSWNGPAIINVFSGERIKLNYGEGILDFIYADFRTPLKEEYEKIQLIEMLREFGKTLELDLPTTETVTPAQTNNKVYNKNQEIVETFFAYTSTFSMLESVLYASLYSAICPPVFMDERMIDREKLRWYERYIMALQKEYLEMIEFCYDEDFHPEVLGNLFPSERLYLYRLGKGLPTTFERKEKLVLSKHVLGGHKMPYGLTKQELIEMFSTMRSEPTEEETAFAEKYHIPGSAEFQIGSHTFLSLHYEARTIEDMLELEFTKMLEQDVRFRKCKRCGRYFIMKGKYDTNYCDRIADGETRNCQELAALENYKARIAGNQAIPLYNKYYKRYAARVRVRQLKEEEFKRWKYQALQKRDECSDGKITVEEFEAWLEASFPNRVKKQKQ